MEIKKRDAHLESHKVEVVRPDTSMFDDRLIEAMEYTESITFYNNYNLAMFLQGLRFDWHWIYV